MYTHSLTRTHTHTHTLIHTHTHTCAHTHTQHTHTRTKQVHQTDDHPRRAQRHVRCVSVCVSLCACACVCTCVTTRTRHQERCWCVCMFMYSDTPNDMQATYAYVYVCTLVVGYCFVHTYRRVNISGFPLVSSLLFQLYNTSVLHMLCNYISSLNSPLSENIRRICCSMANMYHTAAHCSCNVLQHTAAVTL